MKITKRKLLEMIDNEVEKQLNDIMLEKTTEKYHLDENETKKFEGVNLYRIIYANGKKGGWLGSINNLSQKGKCEVLDDAMVYDQATVSGNAKVYGDAWIYGNAKIYDNAMVYGDAAIVDNVEVYGKAKVYGEAELFEQAKVYGNAKVYGDHPMIHGTAKVYGNAKVYGEADLMGTCEVYGKAEVFGNMELWDEKLKSGKHNE